MSDELKKKRKALLSKAGIRNHQLRERWEKVFGHCSHALVSDIVNGNSRSYEKELDLADLLGVKHEEIFEPAQFTRSREVIPDPS